MLKYIEIINITLKNKLAYTVSTLAAIFVNLIQVTIIYTIWMLVYGGQTELAGMTQNQMITYVIMARIICAQIENGINLDFSYMINSGAIAIELLRPIDFKLLLFLKRVGAFIADLFIKGIPVMLIATILYGGAAPQNFLTVLYFFISLFLGIITAFFIELIIGTIAFYTSNGHGLHVFKLALYSLFTGALIPLQFFPAQLVDKIMLLPFANMIYTPVSILVGTIHAENIYVSLVNQIIWIIVLYVVSNCFFSYSIRKMVVHGG